MIHNLSECNLRFSFLSPHLFWSLSRMCGARASLKQIFVLSLASGLEFLESKCMQKESITLSFVYWTVHHCDS